MGTSDIIARFILETLENAGGRAEMQRSMLADRFGSGILPLGYIPGLPEDCLFESRHLGLITAGEIKDWDEKIEKLTSLTEKTLDLDALLALAKAFG